MMEFMTRFVRDCWTVVVPLVAIIAAVPFIWLAGHHTAAGILGTEGTLIVLALNLVYILVRDPKGRWKK